MRLRLIAGTFLVALVYCHWLGAQAVSQDPPPAGDGSSAVTTLHTTARLVVLDVVVTDGHGHPVKGLKAQDFALTEDGVPQTLASFTEHDAAPPPTLPGMEFNGAFGEAALPPNTFAVTPPETGNGAMSVIVLGNVAFQDAPFVRSELRRYFEKNSPGMPVAIFRVDWQGLHLVQGFTADRARLLEAVESKRILPPLGFPPTSATFQRGSVQLTQYLEGVPGRINLIWFGSPVGTQHRFPDITSFVNGMNGARSVLRLSRVALYTIDASGLAGGTTFQQHGVDYLSPPGFSSLGSETATTRTPFGGFEAAGLFGTGEGFAHPNGLFLTGNDRGVFAHAAISDEAELTGGRAFYNTNGFKEVVAEVVATGSHYYTVSYSPTNLDWHGEYRAIHIDVAGVPFTPYRESLYDRLLGYTAGSPQLEYRRGYYARQAVGRPGAHALVSGNAGTPRLPARPAYTGGGAGSAAGGASSSRATPEVAGQEVMQRAMAFASPTPVAMDFRMTVTPAPEVDKTKRDAALPKNNFLTAEWKAAPYRNYQVHYSIRPQELQFVGAAGKYRETLRFVAVVFRDDGEELNSISTTRTIEVGEADYERIMQDGLELDQTVAVPTKPYTNAFAMTADFFVRAAVEEVQTGRVGAIEVPVEWVKRLPDATQSAEMSSPH